jgi:hypothetical protein
LANEGISLPNQGLANEGISLPNQGLANEGISLPNQGLANQMALANQVVQAGRDVSCIDVLKATWPSFQSNLGVTLGIPTVLCGVPLFLVVVPVSIVAFLVAVLGGMYFSVRMAAVWALLPVGLFGALAFAMVYNAIRVGWTKALLKLARGEETTFGDVKTGMPWYWNFLWVNMLIGVATVVGGFFFVVPGLFVAVRAAFAPYLVIEENLGPIQAIVRSNELVTGCSWQILLYHLLYFLANAVAGFVPLVGMVLPVGVMGYFDLALTKIYMIRK